VSQDENQASPSSTTPTVMKTEPTPINTNQGVQNRQTGLNSSPIPVRNYTIPDPDSNQQT
jgi:hypothetical protein